MRDSLQQAEACAQVSAQRGDAQGGGQATLSWAPPSELNGSTLRGYRLKAVPDVGPIQTLDVNDSNATGAVFGGLANGVRYVFPVTAKSSNGDSAESALSNPVWLAENPNGGPRVDAHLALPLPQTGSDLGYQPCLIENDGPPENPRRATCRVLYEGPYTLAPDAVAVVEYTRRGDTSGGGNYLVAPRLGSELYEGCAMRPDQHWVCSNASVRSARHAWQQHWQNHAGSTYFWNAYEDWAGDLLFDCVRAYYLKDPQAAAGCLEVVTGDPDN